MQSITKVLIEASEAYRNRTGIGRFSRSLIRHLPDSIDVAFSPSDYAHRSHIVGQRTLPQRLTNFAEHFKLTQWDIKQAANQENPDLIHSLSFFVPELNRSVPTVSTIFDLAYFELPQEADRFWGAYGRKTMRHFAHRATHIITTSNTSKETITTLLHIPPEKITCVYAGIDERFQVIQDVNQLESVRQKYNLPETFVLYVGAWHRPKNLPTLIRAFEGIENATLVLTGEAQTPEHHEIPRLAKNLNIPIQFLGFVPDEDLPVLYNLATIAIQPSLYEGFSFTPLEAMACGTATIVSNIPVHEEITAGHSRTFSPHSPQELHQSISDLLLNLEKRTELETLGLAHSQQLTWEKTAQHVVAVWQATFEHWQKDQ